MIKRSQQRGEGNNLVAVAHENFHLGPFPAAEKAIPEVAAVVTVHEQGGNLPDRREQLLGAPFMQVKGDVVDDQTT